LDPSQPAAVARARQQYDSTRRSQHLLYLCWNGFLHGGGFDLPVVSCQSPYWSGDYHGWMSAGFASHRPAGVFAHPDVGARLLIVDARLFWTIYQSDLAYYWHGLRFQQNYRRQAIGSCQQMTACSWNCHVHLWPQHRPAEHG
jgi:hypothetical protein